MYFFHLYNKKTKYGVNVDKYIYNEPYELHSHDYYEIEFIIKGAGYQLIENTRYEICPGMICLLDPTSSHSIHPSKEITRYNISFDENILSKTFMRKFFSNENAHIAYLKEEQIVLISRVMEDLIAIFDEQASSPYAAWLVENYISIVILNIFRYKQGETLVLDRDFNEILSYIGNNRINSISLTEISAYAGYSPSYFSAMFKNKTGDTFTAYLTKKRISHAKKLLSSTDLPIKDIAINSGFTSIGRFEKSFLKYVGTNASTYRKNNKN